jgi:ubiquitin-conjugating enzyme E2 Z
MNNTNNTNNASNATNAVITKDTIYRIIRDIKTIFNSPLVEHGIYYQHDDEDMLKGYAMIVGQEGTPYFGGFYFFELKFPYNYPWSPPVVTFCTNNGYVRFNPNLYVNGKVCISILNTWKGEQWTSCQTITSILLSLSSLFTDNPLLNEPGVYKNHSDMKNYNRIVEQANIDTAICDIVQKMPRIYLDKFDMFYEYVLEHFLKNYDKHLEFVTAKSIQQGEVYPCIVTTAMYGMRINVDYTKVLPKLIVCKEIATAKRTSVDVTVLSKENGVNGVNNKEEENEVIDCSKYLG